MYLKVIISAVILLFLITFILSSNYTIYSYPNRLHIYYKEYKNHTNLFSNDHFINSSMDINKEIKIILLWNDFFGNYNWSIGFGMYPFSSCSIDSTNCLVTNNRSLTYKSHAVLFHVNELHIRDKPSKKPSYQRWIFFNQESPLFQFWDTSGYLQWNGLFNWTMTYRPDSDIYIKYGSVERSSQEASLPVYNTKVKGVVWMVSNCKAPSKRWELYQKLSEHIEIDVYGLCGKKKCKRDNNCMEKLANQYKFYLAFENALCQDYITEKAFEPLKHGLVPIVYGMANYTKYLPGGSFINIMDYKNLTELTNYLKSFKNNDTDSEKRYMRFFNWQRSQNIIDTYESYHRSFCDLCRKLNNRKMPMKVYDDLGKWWNKTGTCTSGNNMMKQWINNQII